MIAAPGPGQSTAHAAVSVGVSAAAAMSPESVLTLLGSAPGGLSSQEAARRLAKAGPNAVRSHEARLLPVLLRQLRSPLLVLLAITAALSFVFGQRSDAVIIGLILAASVGLGLVNEYRAEKEAVALHSRVRYRALAVRGGHSVSVDVVELVPGDVVDLELGEIVPADVRLLACTGLECDESVLSGESEPAEKQVAAVAEHAAVADLASCALMGTVVHAGSGRGVVVATAGQAVFGRIALGLGEHQPETEFQVGLRRFSMLLVQVAGVLTVAIFAVNLVLHRPFLDALLFSLAIAVGISPQLLPAVVSTSLAAGSRQLAKRKVLVKRLVCIEDLGDIDVLFTDKTGTLTEGDIRFMRSIGTDGAAAEEPLSLGLACTEALLDDGRAVGGNALDVALWNSPAAAAHASTVQGLRRIATLSFDHERRMTSVLVDGEATGQVMVTKGAPEAVLARCVDVPDSARTALDAEFAAGNRVVAVASRPAPGLGVLDPGAESDLRLAGFLVFLDPPKPSARGALERLAGLGVTVKIVTGDNPAVAIRVCTELGLPTANVCTGAELDGLDEEQMARLVAETTVFARVSPEDKARIVKTQRRTGVDVAFLGDGVNDALALHAADVGISVESASDVAKDAADVLLLEKDLDVLADGVVEGRRIFANTIKYVLMGTSSNFGNMFSAAAASAFLTFLPMLPSQILLNNLLYDSSQLAIPTDNVDAEQLARPSRWDVQFIRRFMLVFGPISSLFDFATFAILLGVFHAGPALFRSGWFVESLATQILVIFVIRTRRTPFFRSRPSVPLLLAAIGVVLVGAVLPATPLASALGFTPLPGLFFATLALLVVAYLVLIEAVKRWFFRAAAEVVPPVARARRPGHRVHRRAARFSTAGKRPSVDRSTAKTA